jgi:hypothetical protein
MPPSLHYQETEWLVSLLISLEVIKTHSRCLYLTSMFFDAGVPYRYQAVFTRAQSHLSS